MRPTRRGKGGRRREGPRWPNPRPANLPREGKRGGPAASPEGARAPGAGNPPSGGSFFDSGKAPRWRLPWFEFPVMAPEKGPETPGTEQRFVDATLAEGAHLTPSAFRKPAHDAPQMRGGRKERLHQPDIGHAHRLVAETRNDGPRLLRGRDSCIHLAWSPSLQRFSRHSQQRSSHPARHRPTPAPKSGSRPSSGSAPRR